MDSAMEMQFKRSFHIGLYKILNDPFLQEDDRQSVEDYHIYTCRDYMQTMREKDKDVEKMRRRIEDNIVFRNECKKKYNWDLNYQLENVDSLIKWYDEYLKRSLMQLENPHYIRLLTRNRRKKYRLKQRQKAMQDLVEFVNSL